MLDIFSGKGGDIYKFKSFVDKVSAIDINKQCMVKYEDYL